MIGRLFIFLFVGLGIFFMVLKIRRVLHEEKRKQERYQVADEIDDSAENKEFYADKAEQVKKLSKKKAGGPDDRAAVEEFIDENK